MTFGRKRAEEREEKRRVEDGREKIYF